jgi:hypothetical protein
MPSTSPSGGHGCLIQSVAVGESRAEVSANLATSDVRIWQQMEFFPGKVDRHDGVRPSSAWVLR